MFFSDWMFASRMLGRGVTKDCEAPAALLLSLRASAQDSRCSTRGATVDVGYKRVCPPSANAPKQHWAGPVGQSAKRIAGQSGVKEQLPT